MIEMRWLVPVEGEKILQYRQQYDATIRALPAGGSISAGTAAMQWSEWRDVPFVAADSVVRIVDGDVVLY